jgi:hypothetical protein
MKPLQNFLSNVVWAISHWWIGTHTCDGRDFALGLSSIWLLLICIHKWVKIKCFSDFFIFLLACMNCTKEGVSLWHFYTCIVYFDQIHPLYYSFLSFLLPSPFYLLIRVEMCVRVYVHIYFCFQYWGFELRASRKCSTPWDMLPALHFVFH